MIEVRWHGRGGQGAVTTVELIAIAAISEGKYAQGFPYFGAERRGSPVMAFNRIDEKKIKNRSCIYNPDVVVVIDPTLSWQINTTDGLKPDGILILNTKKTPQEVKKELNVDCIVATIDASNIAIEELGVNMTNTTMIGAFLKMAKVVEIDSFKSPLENRFGRLAQRNLLAMGRAFDEVKCDKTSVAN